MLLLRGILIWKCWYQHKQKWENFKVQAVLLEPLGSLRSTNCSSLHVNDQISFKIAITIKSLIHKKINNLKNFSTNELQLSCKVENSVIKAIVASVRRSKPGQPRLDQQCLFSVLHNDILIYL